MLGPLLDMVSKEVEIKPQIALLQRQGFTQTCNAQSSFLDKIYMDYSLSSTRLTSAARHFFAISIAFYAVVVEIVLWQIRISHRHQSADFITIMVWPTVCSIIAAVLIVLQPFFILATLLDKFYDATYHSERVLSVTVLALCCFVMVLRTISLGPFAYTTNILTKLSILGVTIMAALSGIASASTLYYAFLFFWQKRFNIAYDSKNEVSHYRHNNRKLLLWLRTSTIENLVINVNRKIEIIESKLLEYEKTNTTLSLSSRTEMVHELGYLYLQLHVLEETLKESIHIKTSKRIFDGVFFCYCIQKVCTTVFRRIPFIIAFYREFPKEHIAEYIDIKSTTESISDPLAVTIANILDFVLFRFNYQHDFDALSRQIAIIISTSLFVCSISAVNTTISYLLSLLPRKFQALAYFAIKNDAHGSSSALPIHQKPLKLGYSRQKENISIIKNMILSELAGIYVVATILMIRSNLPYTVSKNLEELLGSSFTIANVIIDIWFDEIYVLACIATVACICIAKQTNTL